MTEEDAKIELAGQARKTNGGDCPTTTDRELDDSADIFGQLECASELLRQKSAQLSNHREAEKQLTQEVEQIEKQLIKQVVELRKSRGDVPEVRREVHRLRNLLEKEKSSTYYLTTDPFEFVDKAVYTDVHILRRMLLGRLAIVPDSAALWLATYILQNGNRRRGSKINEILNDSELLTAVDEHQQLLYEVRWLLAPAAFLWKFHSLFGLDEPYPLTVPEPWGDRLQLGKLWEDFDDAGVGAGEMRGVEWTFWYLGRELRRLQELLGTDEGDLERGGKQLMTKYGGSGLANRVAKVLATLVGRGRDKSDELRIKLAREQEAHNALKEQLEEEREKWASERQDLKAQLVRTEADNDGLKAELQAAREQDDAKFQINYLTQLHADFHVQLDNLARVVNAKDPATVHEVAAQLLSELAKQGFRSIGVPGEIVAFDKSKHNLTGDGVDGVKPGDEVEISNPGWMVVSNKEEIMLRPADVVRKKLAEAEGEAKA